MVSSFSAHVFYSVPVTLARYCLSPLGLLYQNTKDWATYKQKKLGAVLEAGSLRSGHQCGQVRALSRLQTSLSTLAQCKGPGAFFADFIRALIPFPKVRPSQPNHLPEAPPPTTINLGVWFQHMNFFWRRRAIQTVYSNV